MAQRNESSDPKALYGEGDFVYVQDGNGNVQPDPVPKAWIGTDLLPEGTKAASKAQAEQVAQEEPTEF